MKVVIKSNIVQEIFLQGKKESPIEACQYLAGDNAIASKRIKVFRIIDGKVEIITLEVE